jgi:hypothetical protein
LVINCCFRGMLNYLFPIRVLTLPSHPSSSRFADRLTDSRAQITSYVFDEVRATVPRMDLVSVWG